MKKKGFTLIELLAVIVILAIIALIATPIVMNVIENSKKGAATRSAENYVHAVEMSIARKKLSGQVEDGTYKVLENGNVCKDNDCTEENTIIVDVKGDKPEIGGTIIIQNYQIIYADVVLIINGYQISYDDSKNNFVAGDTTEEDDEIDIPGTDDKEPVIVKVCSPATTSEYGNVPEGEYAYGDEYICELGDGVERRFFLLEDGDKPNPETAGTGEVALIMDQKYTDAQVPNTMPWCDPNGENARKYACNHDGLNPYINYIQTVFGNNVTVSLPTAHQIATAIDHTNWKDSGTITSKKLPEWLYVRGTVEQASVGDYWTTTIYTSSTKNRVWGVKCFYQDMSSETCLGGGYNPAYVYNDSNYGIRPVITINKNQIR